MAKLTLGSTDKQYGDVKALDDLKTATKPLPISGAMAQKRGPGRPAGSTTTPPATTGGAVQPEHLSAMQKLAQAEQVAAYWENLAQTVPTTWTQMYAKRAAEVRDRLALQLYKSTPNFE